MAITKVTEGVRTLGTGEVTAANLAADATSGVTANQDDIALLGFKVAANGSLARYNLVDQSIDAFEDASGVDASASTDEVRNTANYYSGVVEANATGGTVTTYTDGGTDYSVNTFTANDNFVAPYDGTVDYLLLGGGGGGGANKTYDQGAGGGGAGGFRTFTSQSITAGTYAIVSGAGGAGSTTSPANGVDGGVSSAFGNSAAGGGGGASRLATGGGNDGGSGGGSMVGNVLGGASSPVTSPVQGYKGGEATGSHAGAGGGGASQAGFDCSGANPSAIGGNGGAGSTNDFRTGSPVTYAGGGGGGTNAGTIGTGGSSIGGNGALLNNDGTDAVADTGSGGGGGGASSGSGGAGSDGLVVIRYVDGSFTSYNDMTLVSNAVTAESAPTTGDLVMTYTNGAGTATINTDLKAYVSRDNGTTYTQATLADQGDTGGHTILTANGLDISSQPSGTSMRWKIETLNQSASKDTRIQAVSLGWS